MTKKILIAIPCVTGVEHVRESIRSVVGKENVDVIIIDNGATTDTKAVIMQFAYQTGVIVHGNPENVYVNPAWNQAMKFFLDSKQYDYLIIMNSDLNMHKDWDKTCREIWDQSPELSLIPVITNDKNATQVDLDGQNSVTRVFEGTPGVFITLSRKQAEMCYPLIEDTKVWYGDNQIFDTIRACSEGTVIPRNLIAYHSWSQTVQAVPGVYEIIEDDKIAWEKTVKPALLKRIEEIKSKTK